VGPGPAPAQEKGSGAPGKPMYPNQKVKNHKLPHTKKEKKLEKAIREWCKSLSKGSICWVVAQVMDGTHHTTSEQKRRIQREGLYANQSEPVIAQGGRLGLVRWVGELFNYNPGYCPCQHCVLGWRLRVTSSDTEFWLGLVGSAGEI